MSTIAASKWYIAVLLTACAAGYEVPSWAQSQPIASSSGGDAKLATGPEGTYSRTCGYCHGSNVGPVILGHNIPLRRSRTSSEAEWAPCRRSARGARAPGTGS